MQDVGPAVGPDGPVAPWPEVGATGAGAAPAEQPPTAATPPTAVATPSPTDPTWTIRPGDTLWDVAERVRTVRLGRVPTPTETADYLAELVAANASRLAVPGEPDLVFPGQEFVVP
jgi:nucleoid-associated protein YgaU